MMQISIVLAGLLVFASGNAPAQEAASVPVPGTEEVRTGLDARVEKFLAREDSVRDLLMELSETYEVSMMISPKVPDTPVTARLIGLKVREVVDIITSSAGLYWEEVDKGRIARVHTETLSHPEQTAKPESPLPEDFQNGDTPLVTRVFELRYVSVDLVLPMVKALLESRGSLNVTGRALIVTDTQTNLRRIEERIMQLDQQKRTERPRRQ